MAKRFFDVFPITAGRRRHEKSADGDGSRRRWRMNHERDHLRVYLKQHASDSQKRYPASWNLPLHNSFLQGRMMQVKVIEKYHLSEQYTPEKLLDLYRDSILDGTERLQPDGIQSVFGRRRWSLRAKATCCSRWRTRLSAQTRTHEIVEFLEKVFCERCGLDLTVRACL